MELARLNESVGDNMHPVVRALLQGGGKTYFYNKGDECTALTGGWDYATNALNGVTTRTKQADHLFLSLANPTDTQSSLTATTNKVSLSGINKLYFRIDFTRTGTGAFDRGTLAIESVHGSAVAFVLVESVVTNVIIELDVSSYNDTYYVRFNAGAQAAKTSTIKVYEVWGE